MDRNITDQTVEVIPPDRIGPNLEEPQKDYLTTQQRERDEYTTALYKQFVREHEEKQTFTRKSKKIIRMCCMWWVSLLLLVCATLSSYVLFWTDRQAADVIALISAIIPLLVAIIGTLNIVTKHVFPEDDEKYITEIVKLIHENDFKNKQVNVGQPNQHS